MAETLLFWEGLSNIVVSGILAVKPQVIYHLKITQYIAENTHYHLTNVETAPGFNQALACMTAAIGVGQIVASRTGPATRPTMLSMISTWAVLNVLTCLTPKEWKLASATQFVSAVHYSIFSLAYIWLSARPAGAKGKKGGKGKTA